MRYLFLILFVALFLPNLGFGGRTIYGTVELSDFVICPYVAVAFLLSRKNERPQLVDGVIPLMLAFVAWALIGTASITWRFDYNANDAAFFGLLKLAKFVLYGTGAVLTAKALRDPWIRQQFDWALLAAGCLLSVGLFTTSERWGEPSLGEALEGFKSQNAISVTLAILGCYLIGIYLSGGGSARWRRAAPPGLLFMTIGAAVSRGRGGLLAGLAGLAYIIWRRGMSARVVGPIVATATALAASYFFLPAFREEFQKTLWPDPEVMTRYQSGIVGIDDGSRIYTWAHEAPKMLNDVFLGTGFFHRGGNSGLWSTGSHNFFIQMFLETGFVGGLLVLAVVRKMWWHVGLPAARAARLDVPLRSGLVAAVIGGMGGEYFYGGVTLLALLSVYAPAGALPAGALRRLPARCAAGVRRSVEAPT
jgi:hypothetical protein